jgi:glucose-fructose oxidoreductase
MSAALRFALVGLGFSTHVLPDYLAAQECEVGLLCDVDEEKCRRVSAEFGGIPWTTKFEECLADDVDAVDVSTPNHLHAEQAVAALSAGKHVLLQKPMATGVAECARIVAAAEESGRSLGMYMSMRGNPVMQELRAMAAGGAFGQLISLRGRAAHDNIHSTQSKTWRAADYWRRKKELVGGGSMSLIGIHKINLLQWISGERIVSAAAESDNLAARELMSGDDATAAVCRLAGGAIAVLEASYSSRSFCVELYGTAGWASLHRHAALHVSLERPWKGELLEAPGDWTYTSFNYGDLAESGATLRAKYNQNAAFARAVLRGDPPPVSGEEGMRDVAVLEAIYRSAASGRREQPRVPGDVSG